MSENDFELYLSLLARFLRLKSPQRAQIADELRDHLDARLADLLASGLPREEAIRRALEEFGDAASLADHFSRLAWNRRRRWIMRCTMGTIAACAGTIFLAMAFWPMAPGAPLPGRTVADDAPAARTGPKISDQQARRMKVEEALDHKTMKLDFGANAPLEQALDMLSRTIEVDIVISPTARLNPASPISLNLKNPVSARTALELFLEQANAELEMPVSYMIRDGLIYITAEVQALELAVYNCRDLLAEMSQGMILPKKPTELGINDATVVNKIIDRELETAAANQLIEIIQHVVAPITWTDVGGPGSIQHVNGLLVVDQTQAVHRDLQKLLEMLRAEKR